MAENYFPIDFGSTGDSFTITNSGTAPAPCVITFIPKVDFMNLVIEGLSDEPINVQHVYANDALVIDGENRIVTINDEEAFDRYLAWEFPKVQPGVNNIKITNGS